MQACRKERKAKVTLFFIVSVLSGIFAYRVMSTQNESHTETVANRGSAPVFGDGIAPLIPTSLGR